MPPRRPKLPSAAQQHANWIGLLRPDGPFLAASVLAEALPQGLDTVPDTTIRRLKQAWDEVQEAPDLLTPAWHELVLDELLRYTGPVLAQGSALPEEVRPWSGDTRPRPDAVAYGPDGKDGRAARLHLYRRPWEESLTKAGRDRPSAVESAADLCRRQGVPLALLTNGQLWILVHATPGQPTGMASFDADLWLEEPDLLRAFASLLGAQRLLPPPVRMDGAPSDSLAALFDRSAKARQEVTDTLGKQVLRAVELLVGELSLRDRESGGRLLAGVAPREAYQATLTVMMRLVFLLYAEDQKLMPVDSRIYAESYSVAGLYEQLEDDRHRYGDEVGDRRAAAWPRLLATFAAVHGGSEYDEMRIPPYGGTLFDPERFPWLPDIRVRDRVVHEILDALLILRGKRKNDAAERLSYKSLGVEQIGHVYEGLLEFSCLHVTEPYVGLFGDLEPELPLAELERAASEEDDFPGWLVKRCKATPARVRKALAAEPAPDLLANLDTACDNDARLADRVRPLLGLLRLDLRRWPTVFPAGSLIITQVGDRRATGTHYTPAVLAEEVVEHTLAPLCFSPGPAEGAEPEVWRAKSADELLSLKVLDPAMGSGAFLVAACRYLGDRVVEAWERDGIPDDIIEAVGPEADRDDLLLEARRRVAARCIYGVDRDDQAVELGKLSLWLVTLAKDKPFSFLDHALRCGDSLVGLTSEDQLVAFDLDPQEGYRKNSRLTNRLADVTGSLLNRVQELRAEIQAKPVTDAHHGEELAERLHETERLTDHLRLAADAVTAAALAGAGQAKSERGPYWEDQEEDAKSLFDRRLGELAEDVEQALEVDEDGWPTFAAEQAQKRVRETITPMLQGPRAEPINPLHWALEFPEVMRQDGFNAVVGNPPFIGGQKLTGSIGEDLREYLVEWLAKGKRGSADLCAYFLLRNLSLASRGRVGIIATNTIAQGDTREVGIDQVYEWGWTVYRAVKSQPWPGTASLEVSLLWVGRPLEREQIDLDHQKVSGITTSLDPASRVHGKPFRLVANSNISFVGSYVLGKGFILTPDQARALLSRDGSNKEVVFPYLNGEDLNQSWDLAARRWIINFHDWPESRARLFEEVFAIVEREVRPERESKTYSKNAQQRWWQYERSRPELYEAISDLDKVLVFAQTSKTQQPVFVDTGQVLSHMLVVVASDRYSALAFHSSNIQYLWTERYSANMRTDLRFIPSDCFETLARCHATGLLEQVGRDLESSRRAVMERRKIGLTSLYNLVHDDTICDPDVVRLRDIHVDLDNAVRESYAFAEDQEPAIREFEKQVSTKALPSWGDIQFFHGFYETQQGARFTIRPQAQRDVLDKLLALNNYRHRQEINQGVTARKKRRRRSGSAGPSSAEVNSRLSEGLFPPNDALF